ncbi:MAG: shikimate kinase [Phycisphaerae bacterium]
MIDDATRNATNDAADRATHHATGDAIPNPHPAPSPAGHRHREPKPSIAVIGYRGSGKSTVGRLLATDLGARFVDTDDRVVERSGMSIADIFATEGEAGFRRREADAIAEVTASTSDPVHPVSESPPDRSNHADTATPVVISVGGGAILHDPNVAALRAAAIVVWLTAPADVLWDRIRCDKHTPSARPPLTPSGGLSEVRRLLHQRSPRYRAAADIIIDTAGVSPHDVAARIEAELRAQRARRDHTAPGP